VTQQLERYRNARIAGQRLEVSGQDSAAALGQNAVKSAYQLWAERRGLIQDEPPESEKMNFARIMEDVIANQYAMTRAARLHRGNPVQRHPRYPWMVSIMERMLEGERRGLEVRNVDLLAPDLGDWGEPGSGAIPVECTLQVCHDMAVTGYAVWDIAVCIGGNRLQVYTIERDLDLEQMLIEGEHEFWQCVESGREPDFSYESAQAQSLLQKLYPHTDGSTVTLDDTIQYWHEVKNDAQKQARTYQAVVDTADAHILKAMGNASVGTLPFGGEYRRRETTPEGYAVQAQSSIECCFVAAGNRRDG
jgi:predicted phage-related endonuclease